MQLKNIIYALEQERGGFIKEGGLESVISSILLDIFKERLGVRYPAFKERLFQEGVDICAEIEHIINVGGRSFLIQKYVEFLY